MEIYIFDDDKKYQNQKSYIRIAALQNIQYKNHYGIMAELLVIKRLHSG